MKLLYFLERGPGPCVLQNEMVGAIERQFKDRLEVERIDCKENQEIVKKYNIREIPSIIIEDGGKEVARFSGLTQEIFMRRAIERSLADF